MMMTTKEIAQGMVKKYQSLIGQKQKTPFGYLPIEDIKPVEWESGHFYDVFLISYHQSEDSEATDEIRTSLFDFLDKMGLLDTFPDSKTNSDPLQKYFTTSKDLAFDVAQKFKPLLKSNKKFVPPPATKSYNIDYIKVHLLPNMDEPCYQVLICNDPLKTSNILLEKDLVIPSIDLLTYLQLEGYDLKNDRHLKEFIEYYL